MEKIINDEFEILIDTLAKELISIPDDQILDDLDPAAVKADGLRILQAAKEEVARAGLTAPKSGVPEVETQRALTPEKAL